MPSSTEPEHPDPEGDGDQDLAGPRSRQQEQRIRLGLIQYVSEHTVDQDYAWVSRHDPRRGGPPARVAAVVVLAVFGLLVFTAASQTSQAAAGNQRQRQQLIEQIDGRRDALDDRLARARTLTRANARLQSGLLDKGDSSLARSVRRLGVSAGAQAVTGPGVVLVADDAPDADTDRERVLDKDLQRLVNGLWAAGAEAVSVNGQRITNVTAIREAGSAINVNYIPLRAPYTVRAIGDPKTLASRFADTSSGAAWFDLVQQVGLRLDVRTSDRLVLPAAGGLVLRYARSSGRSEGGRP